MIDDDARGENRARRRWYECAWGLQGGCVGDTMYLPTTKGLPVFALDIAFLYDDNVSTFRDLRAYCADIATDITLVPIDDDDDANVRVTSPSLDSLVAFLRTYTCDDDLTTADAFERDYGYVVTTV